MLEPDACPPLEVTTPARPDGRNTTPCAWADEDPSLIALLEQARIGDHKAFGHLVERTHGETYTLALRLTGDPHDARDVAQEAYLRAFRSIGSFRGESRFSTWMYRITANCASSHLGRRRRHRVRNRELDSTDDLVDLRCESDPQLWVDATDLRDRLSDALADLPPKLRAVVVLRDVYDLDHTSIAEELGISSGAAKVRLHRARRKLHTALFPDLDQVDARAL